MTGACACPARDRKRNIVVREEIHAALEDSDTIRKDGIRHLLILLKLVTSGATNAGVKDASQDSTTLLKRSLVSSESDGRVGVRTDVFSAAAARMSAFNACPSILSPLGDRWRA
jgi:hypothetical protein